MLFIAGLRHHHRRPLRLCPNCLLLHRYPADELCIIDHRSMTGPLMPASSAMSTQRSAAEMGNFLARITRYTTVILLLTGLPLMVCGLPILRSLGRSALRHQHPQISPNSRPCQCDSQLVCSVCSDDMRNRQTGSRRPDCGFRSRGEFEQQYLSRRPFWRHGGGFRHPARFIRQCVTAFCNHHAFHSSDTCNFSFTTVSDGAASARDHRHSVLAPSSLLVVASSPDAQPAFDNSMGVQHPGLRLVCRTEQAGADRCGSPPQKPMARTDEMSIILGDVLESGREFLSIHIFLCARRRRNG